MGLCPVALRVCTGLMRKHCRVDGKGTQENRKQTLWATIKSAAREKERGDKGANVHQQTGLAAGTVADDDELPADLSHCNVVGKGGLLFWVLFGLRSRASRQRSDRRNRRDETTKCEQPKRGRGRRGAKGGDEEREKGAEPMKIESARGRKEMEMRKGGMMPADEETRVAARETGERALW